METDISNGVEEPKRGRGRPSKKVVDTLASQKDRFPNPPVDDGGDDGPTGREVAPFDADGTLLLPDTTRVSLDLPSDLSFDKWMGYLRILKTTEAGLPWWIGDMFQYALARGKEYADQAMQACSDLGFAEHTVHNYSSICDRFKDKKRRRDDLSFSHHKAVAYLENKKRADEMLALAATQKWSVRQIEEAAREAGAKRVKATLAVDSPRKESPEADPAVVAAVERAEELLEAEVRNPVRNPDAVAKAAEPPFPVTEEQFRDELLPVARRAQDKLNDAIAGLEQPKRENINKLNEQCGAARDELIEVMELLESYGAEAL